MEAKLIHTSHFKYDPNVYSLLTDETDTVLQGMGDVVFDYTCKTFHGDVAPIEVTGFTDPEENVDYISLVVDVPLDASKALDFWDELGEEVEQWIATLPPDKAEIARKQITTRVRWN